MEKERSQEYLIQIIRYFINNANANALGMSYFYVPGILTICCTRLGVLNVNLFEHQLGFIGSYPSLLAGTVWRCSDPFVPEAKYRRPSRCECCSESQLYRSYHH